MGKCIRCGCETYRERICRSCMNEWTEMRAKTYNTISKKYGMFSPENQVIFKKEMKRLEKIWRKNKDEWKLEIENYGI